MSKNKAQVTDENSTTDNLIFNSITSSITSFTGSLFKTIGSAIFLAKIPSAPLATVATSTFRGALGGLSLSALTLFLKSMTNDSSELNISTQCLISLTAAISYTLVSSNYDDSVSELIASGIGLASLITYIICKSEISASNDTGGSDNKSEKPDILNLTPKH